MGSESGYHKIKREDGLEKWGWKQREKNFTEWELKYLNQLLSFDDVWELGEEKYRLNTQDLIGIYVFQNIKTNRYSHTIFLVG
ncbi:hypothetical protein F0342_10830 [Bacillus sp. CH30_1T]|uniref:hypothetical protein n=1 Tax=Bacillus sp. CH30_1T TaxID=2604836 RepID=UPI0011EE3B8D|nr:hypothetical protein [Bacillus sp. CH30_1T]KAA0564635.1 hypothetical protein F0342_10830 [Bacillus sp. CH30_1T]